MTILFNLLPHREWARQKKKEQFRAHFMLAMIISLFIVALATTLFNILINDQIQANKFLQEEIKGLEVSIKEIANIEQKITQLKSRQNAVESLRSGRNVPQKIFNGLLSTPPGLYYTEVKQEGLSITLTGISGSTGEVASFLRQLEQPSEDSWLEVPRLTEVISDNLRIDKQDSRKVVRFQIKALLVAQSAHKNRSPEKVNK